MTTASAILILLTCGLAAYALSGVWQRVWDESRRPRTYRLIVYATAVVCGGIAGWQLGRVTGDDVMGLCLGLGGGALCSAVAAAARRWLKAYRGPSDRGYTTAGLLFAILAISAVVAVIVGVVTTGAFG